MAFDKIIDSAQLESDLTSVAAAIRAKGATADPLSFPAGFVSAVNNIFTSSAFGYIVANFPTTATSCTCSSGGTVLEADAAGLARGQFVFEVPAAGTWTVTISSGTDTKSKSVSITTKGSIENVVLKFNLYILRNGSSDYEFSGYQGRAVSFTNGEIVTTSTGSSTSPFCFKIGINSDEWSTLVFKVKNTDLSTTYPFTFGVKSSSDMTTYYAQRNYAAETILTEISNDYREILVDVSTLKGTYFVHGIGVGHTWTSEIYFE